MRSKRILLLWHQQDENFGDVLLYQTTKEYLENAGYDTEIHEVGDTEIRISEHANQCDFVIFAGGGIIERYIPQAIQNIRKLKQLLKVEYGVLGVGIGEFDYREYADALRYWVDQAVFFYVRDEASSNYLNRLSKNHKVIFSADIVFGNKMFFKNIEIGNETGLNLRDIPYRDIQGEFDWPKINKALENIDCKILIPDCNDQKTNIHLNFVNLMELSSYDSLSQDLKIERVISAIQKCNIVIAMRFHVILVAALMGIVPIPILYCPKVRYLAKQLGIMELAVELGEWEKIPEKVDLIKRDRKVYLENIDRAKIVLRKKVQEMYDCVLHILEAS